MQTLADVQGLHGFAYVRKNLARPHGLLDNRRSSHVLGFGG